MVRFYRTSSIEKRSCQFVKLSDQPIPDSSVRVHLPEWLRIGAGNEGCYCRFVCGIIGKFLFCHGETGMVQKKWMSVSAGKMDSCQSVNPKWPVRWSLRGVKIVFKWLQDGSLRYFFSLFPSVRPNHLNDFPDSSVWFGLNILMFLPNYSDHLKNHLDDLEKRYKNKGTLGWKDWKREFTCQRECLKQIRLTANGLFFAMNMCFVKY